MDREEYLKLKLQEHYDEAESLGDELFVVVLQGSQNYNLDMYTTEYKSDVDTKAIVLPSFEQFCNGAQPKSHTHIRANDEHIDIKDIRVMFDTFRKQNVNFVEILFSDFYIVNPKYKEFWEELRSLGEALTHCHPNQTLRTMAGMSMEKKKALCHPYPTIIDKINKYGYDGKQLHHIIRINEFMKAYLSGKSFKECLSTYSDDKLEMLKAAKLNRYSLEEAIELADFYDADNNRMKDEYISAHEEFVDPTPYNALNKLKVEILKKWFKEQLLGD